MGFIASLINSLLSLIAAAITAILSLLPSSPFAWNLDGASPVLTWIFWLIPIPQMLTTMTLYISAVVAYFVVRIALRWLKVVGS
ncbi:hypothetical protein [Desulfosporosinus sp. BG]|uniref:hypothetical protein n=1 Tax=Desulfosporosinus sp. BG TaxID=1633135 RepID=UPI00083A3BE0|nr:hypothetical protein [Desulfosporosinus sp. BG]ODA38724.1 hypothetical protein DSBG_4495 [Desulfosporosinus sp. BG]